MLFQDFPGRAQAPRRHARGLLAGTHSELYPRQHPDCQTHTPHPRPQTKANNVPRATGDNRATPLSFWTSLWHSWSLNKPPCAEGRRVWGKKEEGLSAHWELESLCHPWCWVSCDCAIAGRLQPRTWAAVRSACVLLWLLQLGMHSTGPEKRCCPHPAELPVHSDSVPS